MRFASIGSGSEGNGLVVEAGATRVLIDCGFGVRDTAARVLPYYIREILPRVLRGEHVLVSAHGNSLRALVMVLDKHTPDSITKLNLDTGVPMIYRLNADSTVASKLDLAA